MVLERRQRLVGPGLEVGIRGARRLLLELAHLLRVIPPLGDDPGGGAANSVPATPAARAEKESAGSGGGQEARRSPERISYSSWARSEAPRMRERLPQYRQCTNAGSISMKKLPHLMQPPTAWLPGARVTRSSSRRGTRRTIFARTACDVAARLRAGFASAFRLRGVGIVDTALDCRQCRGRGQPAAEAGPAGGPPWGEPMTRRMASTRV